VIDYALWGSAFVTFFVIMDPTGIVPIFLGMVGKRPAKDVRRLALQATATSFGVIVTFAIFGDQILEYLGISLPALQGAGGLLLLLVALQLLLGGISPGSGQEEEVSIALVPLGTPLLAGPGAIVATILFVRQSEGSDQVLAVAAAIVSIHVVIWLALRYSTVLMRVLRPAGVTIISRIMGLLLAAIAVQLLAASVVGFVDAYQSGAALG